MITIDPATLSQAQARAHLAVELAQLEQAEIALVFAGRTQRRRIAGYVRTHRANVLALADIAEGPLPDWMAAMSDADLLAALSA